MDKHKPPQEREQQASSSLLNRPPRWNLDGGGCGADGVRNSLGSVELRSSDQCREMDASKLVGAPAETVNSVDADVAVKDVTDSVADGVETLMMMKNSESFINSSNTRSISDNFNNPSVVVEANTGKRKRGRPPRSQGVARRTPPQSRKIKEDEDVCFICFDGGSLVLCDHRSCPKAYHPACIKRDEAFFMSTAKWDCGWHLCNSCQRAAYYMCYTCTYSLCKGCTRGADFSTVRGSKGFCGTCMKTIMLIENGTQANGEVVQVDFDDKTSWEYLFKVYWVCLKENLSLTLHELTRAKKPFKESAVLASRIESRVELRNGNDGEGCSSDIFRANMETNLTNIKANDQQKDLNEVLCPNIETCGNDSVIPLPEGAKWASKELLEIVAHMKNGDTSMLSNIDLQALLLEYVQTNNLRDPLQKSEIICDSRLKSLSGKERVGHVEMLKLLEYHVFTNITSPPVEPIKGEQVIMETNRKRKTRRRTVEKAAPVNNPDEYAAINFHNIHLIYLTRNLMENMIDDDIDKFREKAIGSIVRIKISGGDQKHEAYRLVQVVGTSKASKPYNIGSKTIDFVLEILNLDKKELVPIDELSNQEFPEDECIRLRQSIKCGLNERLKVVEIKEKAMTLKALKVNDWLEAEISRLTQLRERASEKGHKKEYMECVEKLEVLNSAEGRQCKLQEIPEVHADPNMDPSYDSDDGAGFVYDKKKDESKRRRRASGGGRKKKTESNVHQNQTRGDESTFYVDKDGTIHTSGSIRDTRDDDEDKIWNYRDPMGKIQGPFPMAQLRKWSMHFPPHLRVWRINENHDDSILLTDALQRKYNKDVITPVVQLQQPHEVIDEKGKSLNAENRTTDTEIEQVGLDNELAKSEASGSHSSGVNTPTQNDTNSIDNIVNEVIRSVGLGSESSPVSNPTQNGANIHGIDNVNEIIRSVGLGSESSPVTNPTQNDDNIIDNNSTLTMGDDGFGSHSSGVTELSQNHITHGNVNDWLATSDNRLSSDSSSDVADSKNVSVCLDSLPTQPQVECSIPKFQVGEIIQELAKTSDKKRPDCNIPVGQSPVQIETAQSINIDGSLAGPVQIETAQSPVQIETAQSINIDGFLAGPVPKSLEILAKNGSIDFLNLGGSTPKAVNQDLRLHAATDIPPLQNSNANIWNAFATPPVKHVEEWDLNISHMPSVGMPIDQITKSSPSYPIPDAPTWQAMVAEPADFASLVDESVSDLLAEVEAMESLNGGISSATSGMRPPDEDEDDCFSPLHGFILARGPGDFFYPQKQSHSGADADYNNAKPMTVPCSSGVDMATADLLWRLDPQNRDAHWAPIHNNSNVNTRATGGGLSQVSRVADMNWGNTHNQATPPIRNPSLSMSTITMSTPYENNARISSLSMGTTTISTPYENSRISNNQSRYDGDNRFTGQRDHDIGDNRFWGQRDHNYVDNRLSGQRDRDFEDNRSSWNNHRQQPTTNGGGHYREDRQQPQITNGGVGYYYRQQPPKGQRVCKFYESGHCKRGASCNYWHPYP